MKVLKTIVICAGCMLVALNDPVAAIALFALAVALKEVEL